MFPSCLQIYISHVYSFALRSIDRNWTKEWTNERVASPICPRANNTNSPECSTMLSQCPPSSGWSECQRQHEETRRTQGEFLMSDWFVSRPPAIHPRPMTGQRNKTWSGGGGKLWRPTQPNRPKLVPSLFRFFVSFSPSSGLWEIPRSNRRRFGKSYFP